MTDERNNSSDDPTAGVTEGRDIAETIPGAQSVVTQGCGHEVSLRRGHGQAGEQAGEQPADGGVADHGRLLKAGGAASGPVGRRECGRLS